MYINLSNIIYITYHSIHIYILLYFPSFTSLNLSSFNQNNVFKYIYSGTSNSPKTVYNATSNNSSLFGVLSAGFSILKIINNVQYSALVNWIISTWSLKVYFCSANSYVGKIRQRLFKNVFDFKRMYWTIHSSRWRIKITPL